MRGMATSSTKAFPAPSSGVQKAHPDVLLCFSLSHCCAMVTSSQWTLLSSWQQYKRKTLRRRWPLQRHWTATSSWGPGGRSSEGVGDAWSSGHTQGILEQKRGIKNIFTHDLACLSWLLLLLVLPSIFLYMACSSPLRSEYFFTSLDSSAWMVCARRKQLQHNHLKDLHKFPFSFIDSMLVTIHFFRIYRTKSLNLFNSGTNRSSI